MRQYSLLVFWLAICGSRLLPAQDAGSQQRFAGTWEARFKEKVICTITLETGKTVAGAMHACQINVNSDGELIEAGASQDSEDKPDPILNPKIRGHVLAFEVQDDEQPLKFELKLTGAAQSELQILNAPAPVKPIHFQKK